MVTGGFFGGRTSDDVLVRYFEVTFAWMGLGLSHSIKRMNYKHVNVGSFMAGLRSGAFSGFAGLF